MSTEWAGELVPLANPGQENVRLETTIVAAMTRVVKAGSYILGEEVKRFEANLAARTKTAGAVGVGCCTEALAISLLALGVTPGDEVVAPSHTAGPTVAAIRMVGATPVLVEVGEFDYCVSPTAVASAIGPRTKAAIAVHLYGQPADMSTLAAIGHAKGIAIVEDCAQAQGGRIGAAEVGGFGDCGCFSFYPTKNLGALGDGGAVTARSASVVERLRALRTYGWTAPQYAELENGRCTRLDELQAAILTVKLAHLDASNARRREIAARYAEELGGAPIILPHERTGTTHVYHLYVIRSDRRDALAAHLKSRGIMTGRHYPFPVHVQPGLADKARVPIPLVTTERLAREILSLPIYADMTDAKIERVVSAVREFF